MNKIYYLYDYEEEEILFSSSNYEDVVLEKENNIIESTEIRVAVDLSYIKKENINLNMKYEEFLLSQILRDNIEEYNKLPYDELYKLSIEIYNIHFYNSLFNDLEKDLYECFNCYIENNKNILLNKIKNLI